MGETVFAVARYNPDGTLDDTFNGDGWVTIAFPGSNYGCGQSVAIDPSGKIIVAGAVQFESGQTSDFGLACLDANGSLDANFGANGLVSTAFGSAYVRATALAVDPGSGAIVVAGDYGSGTNKISRWRATPAMVGWTRVSAAWAR